MTARSSTVHVRLVGVPVDHWHRGRVWFEGLIREFDILAADREGTPGELLAFVSETRKRFEGFTDEPEAVLEEAHERGEQSLDLEMVLPPAAGPVAEDLLRHIERAIEYCQSGDLLTLTPDDELLRYLRWSLGEISRQVGGESPRSWQAQPPAR